MHTQVHVEEVGKHSILFTEHAQHISGDFCLNILYNGIFNITVTISIAHNHLNVCTIITTIFCLIRSILNLNNILIFPEFSGQHKLLSSWQMQVAYMLIHDSYGTQGHDSCIN
jgi:hypothetical protein